MRKELIQNQEKKNIRLISSLLNDVLNLFPSAVYFVCKFFLKNIFSEWNSHFRCLFWLLKQSNVMVRNLHDIIIYQKILCPIYISSVNIHVGTLEITA